MLFNLSEVPLISLNGSSDPFLLYPQTLAITECNRKCLGLVLTSNTSLGKTAIFQNEARIAESRTETCHNYNKILPSGSAVLLSCQTRRKPTSSSAYKLIGTCHFRQLHQVAIIVVFNDIRLLKDLGHFWLCYIRI